MFAPLSYLTSLFKGAKFDTGCVKFSAGLFFLFLLFYLSLNEIEGNISCLVYMFTVYYPVITVVFPVMATHIISRATLRQCYVRLIVDLLTIVYTGNSFCLTFSAYLHV